MDRYDLQRAVRPLIQFIEDLTNWYIRRSRRRFWKSSNDDDKAQAYATLYEVLLRISKIAAPFVPFISEAIYRNLRADGMPESVHLCDFPEGDDSARREDLEVQMRDVMSVVKMGRAIRTDYNLKIRQPLKSIHIACRDKSRLGRIRKFQDVIAEELNAKDVEFSTNETTLATLSAKADYRRLGPRLGKKMKSVAVGIQHLEAEQCEALLAGQSFTLEVDGDSFVIGPDDVTIERTPKEGLAVASAGDLVVALEIHLTPALLEDGLAREFVNKVQNMRKAAELEVTQRIRICFAADEEVRMAILNYADYIKTETLARDLVKVEKPGDTDFQTWNLNGRSCQIRIECA